jgi:nucleoside recognition membrane protein YjiH
VLDNITAIFNGNEFYNGSTSMSKTLIVGDSPIHLLNTGFPLILLLILIWLVVSFGKENR